jgi:hypothetical protein
MVVNCIIVGFVDHHAIKPSSAGSGILQHPVWIVAEFQSNFRIAIYIYSIIERE